MATNAYSIQAELQHDHELFNYTRGRFVRDESYELSQRRICFDIKELKRVAAATVGSKSCVTIEKYPDGLHSKAFLLTMDDGMQVVAKIPNPNAEPPRLLTASEAATMDFVHTPATFVSAF